MVPANHRLEPGDGLVVETDDRLVEDLDLLAAEGAAEIGFERREVGAVLAQRRPEGLDAVSAEALGMIHADLGVLDHLLGLDLLAVVHGDADRRGEERLLLAERDRRAERPADRLGKGRDPLRLRLGDQQEGELVAGQARQRILRLEQPGQAAGDGEQDRVADRRAEVVVDLLEAVDVEHEDRRPRGALGLGAGDRRLEPVEIELAVGQAGEVVVDRIVEESLLGGPRLGDVDQRADGADHLAVGAQHRPGAEVEPHVVAVLGAEAEVLRDPAAALLDGGVEQRLEPVAVAGMEEFEPVPCRPLEGAALEPEQVLRLGPGEDAVALHVPVPDDVAGAGQRQGAPLGVADRPLVDHAAGKGMLHHGEADQ